MGQKRKRLGMGDAMQTAGNAPTAPVAKEVVVIRVDKRGNSSKAPMERLHVSDLAREAFVPDGGEANDGEEGSEVSGKDEKKKGEKTTKRNKVTGRADGNKGKGVGGEAAVKKGKGGAGGFREYTGPKRLTPTAARFISSLYAACSNGDEDVQVNALLARLKAEVQGDLAERRARPTSVMSAIAEVRRGETAKNVATYKSFLDYINLSLWIDV